MSQSVVIDLGFGDAGKGLVTDWLCREEDNPVVVRYSGGHQVGHCVRTESAKHIFSNFGSGTIAGAPTIWNAKTIDPVGFCNEYKDIKQFNPKISINPMCPVTTPYDKVINVRNDKANNHSTIGVGFGATIEREENHYHLYYGDLFYPNIRDTKIELIKDYYRKLGIFAWDFDLKEFSRACKNIILLASKDTPHNGTKGYIYESSQGLMLDQEYGFFPYVTRSKLATQEIEVDHTTTYYLVTRGYQTRHGNGPCSEIIYNPNNPGETNVLNEHQGEFKKRVLDLDTLLYAINIDKNIRKSYKKNLVVTCLDQMETYPYIYKGKLVTCDNEKQFLSTIWDLVCDETFMSMYVSHGPTAKDISLFR